MIGELFGGLLVAFGLYSALPLPQIEWKRSTMRYALGFLPLIGVLVGACEYGWLLLAGKLDGTNSHHIAEAMFKAFGRALSEAVSLDARLAGEIPSTKGAL